MSLTVILIDDELAALELLESYCEMCEELTVIGPFQNPQQAILNIRKNKPDLVISDINMPGISGLDLAQCLPDPTQLIFVTAHLDHAIDGYEHGVTDFLLKPVMFGRFLKAIDKAKQVHQSSLNYPLNEFVFVKEDGIKKRIDLKALKFVQSVGDYIKIFHGQTTTLVHETLTQFEVKLNHPSLVRIHRSTLVNLAFVDEINTDHLIIDGTDLTIGKTYRPKLQSMLKMT